VRALDVRTVAGNVVVPAGLALATFLGSRPGLRAYDVPGAVAVLAAAALGSTIISYAAARWRRQPPLVSYGLSLIGLVAVLFAASGFHPASIARQIVHGPSRVLSETLPLSGGRSQLCALVVLTWVGGAAAAELMARVPSRRALGSIAFVIPLALFVICYAVATAAPGRDVVAGPLLLLTLALIAVARRFEADASAGTESAPVADDGSASRNARPAMAAAVASRNARPAMAGAVAAGAATAALVIVVPAVPALSHHPVTLHRATPTAVSRVIDPLDAMANLRDGDPSRPPQAIASVTTDAASTGYLAVGVLNSYDGSTWRFDSTFEPTGGRISVSPGSAGTVEFQSLVDQRVQVTARLPVPLLPSLDRPMRLSGLSVLADGTTGMLLPTGGAGGPGLDYLVVSQAPRLVLGALPPADGIDVALGPDDLSLPPDSTAAMTTTLRFLSTLTGERPSPSVAFLQTAAEVLQSSDKRIDPTLIPSQTSIATTPSTTTRKGKKTSSSTTTTTLPVTAFGGTSLSEVVHAVTVARSATPEQFATLFAMAARDLGVPARVVTGLRIAASSSGTPVPAGTHTVTNRQAWAWVEVPVSGVGWVVVDPTPDATTGVVAPPPAQAQTPATTLPLRQANAVPRSTIQGGHPLAKPAVVKLPHQHATPVWLMALMAFGGLLLLAAIAGPGQAGFRRWLRRRYRRRLDPAELAVGAWLEVLDGLSQVGMEAALGATTSEVAAEAGMHFGADVREPVAEVGTLADRALCSTTTTIGREEAEKAWELQREVRNAVRGGLDRRQRARALLAVGSGPRRPVGPDRQ
jgi:Transglutaminase-like superfamily/TgpA N-terminal domain